MKKLIYCGDVKMGGGSPISIQSMTNTNTADIKATMNQIDRLTNVGCEIIRLAVPDMEAARALKIIKQKTKIPLVADIHFDYRLALESIKSGVDKIRINPGNIGPREKVSQVVKMARQRGIPIRVGVNSGSLEKDILAKYGRVTAEGLAESAIRNVEILEDMNFEDIVISLKSSDVRMNFQAYKIVHEKSPYPLHIGVTEAGTPSKGRIKSAAGIGALLLEGIGDTMRVSLTVDPAKEVLFAKDILTAVGLRRESVEIVSCPTCGRTEVDLEAIVTKIEEGISRSNHGGAIEGKSLTKNPRENFPENSKNGRYLKIAVMGCPVNGPGEAKEADIGVACGRGRGVLFSKGKIVATVSEEEIVDAILKMAEEYEGNT